MLAMSVNERSAEVILVDSRGLGPLRVWLEVFPVREIFLSFKVRVEWVIGDIGMHYEVD